MSVIIGADIVPTTSNLELFEKGRINKLIGSELLTILQSANYRIFNLEAPLTDEIAPIKKHGPALAASTKSVVGLKGLCVDLFTLANNHILDQGDAGLQSTMRLLEKYGISVVGAGNNLQEAMAPYVFEVKGMKYGVYACAEHEFSIATDVDSGANPFDPLESLDHIVELKRTCDYVIVLYHGGKEHYRYPSPYLQKVCRKLIEKGADLVICQHSHCIGCKEEYKEGTIIYGQGNFLFDDNNSEYWKTGLLVEIQDDKSIKYIPVKKVDECVRLAHNVEAERIVSDFELRSKEICVNGFIETRYAQFSKKMQSNYILYFLGLSGNFVFSALNKISGQQLRKYVIEKTIKKRGLGIRNYIECEAHRELLLKGIMEK